MPEEKEDKGIGLVKWIISTILIAVITWCVSIEVRMSIWKSDQVKEMSQRIANLETALSPVLIEYGVQQKLAEISKKTAPAPTATPPPKTEPSKEEVAKLREAEKMKIRAQYPNLAK
jgi:hypothetical protein